MKFESYWRRQLVATASESLGMPTPPDQNMILKRTSDGIVTIVTSGCFRDHKTRKTFRVFACVIYTV